MLYTLRFFSSKCSLFHNSNLFGSCVVHILYTGCAKTKKKSSGAKGLKVTAGFVCWSRSSYAILATVCCDFDREGQINIIRAEKRELVLLLEM